MKQDLNGLLPRKSSLFPTNSFLLKWKPETQTPSYGDLLYRLSNKDPMVIRMKERDDIGLSLCNLKFDHLCVLIDLIDHKQDLIVGLHYLIFWHA